MGLALLEPRAPVIRPVIRYERQRPGERIHPDIESLGRFERIGHRISGDRTGRSKSRGIGWDHLHVAIDDASRLAYTEVLPGLGRQDATAFLARALDWFAWLGLRRALRDIERPQPGHRPVDRGLQPDKTHAGIAEAYPSKD